jgi:hypothetical protein
MQTIRAAAAKIKKYFFKAFLLGAANRRYVATSAVFQSVVSADPAKLFMFVVAFNEPELTVLHWRAMKKFCRDAYEYFVIDNSNRAEASEAIRQFCEGNRINYVRLPENPAPRGDGSLSHGFALNWAYHNLVANLAVALRPRIFGIVDSDLFPIKPFAAAPHLEKSDAWGIIMERRSVVALWPGFAFFRTERFGGRGGGHSGRGGAEREPNFLPGHGVDTGGRVKVDGAAVKKLPEVYDLDRDRVDMQEIPVPDGIAPARRYGPFVHLTGASWAAGSADAKLRWVERILAS